MTWSRTRLRPAASFLSLDEIGLQSCLALFPNYRPIKFSVDHSAGITVDEFSKSIPCQRTFSGRIFL
jgi:hypothetical protein